MLVIEVVYHKVSFFFVIISAVYILYKVIVKTFYILNIKIWMSDS